MGRVPQSDGGEFNGQHEWRRHRKPHSAGALIKAPKMKTALAAMTYRFSAGHEVSQPFKVGRLQRSGR